MDVSITAECRISALGMESGEIDDAQLSASSSFDMISVGPQNARWELVMIDDNYNVLEYFSEIHQPIANS